MAERQFGPYRLVRQIAVGGMAEIHLAKTRGIAGFEKYVALKMIHPNFAEDDQFIQMLVDEAKIAVQLNHANIAQTFDLGRVGDTYYITMEYVDGADLYKILRKGSEMDGFAMPLDVAAFIAKEIASALDHAHRKRDHTGKTLGIVHRDVSPQNVLVSYAGEVKLVDFGIAKATMKARQTAVGVIKGKYYYMSPEQAWGDQIDYRSDIFSAGIVLYEMLVGQMLYLEEDLHALLDMVRKADIAPPSTLRKGIPPQLEKIVMRALAKERRDRYQSAGDFATDLERFLHAYSPVFTGTKVAALIKQVVGLPVEIPDEGDAEPELRDGPSSTHTLSTEDLIHDKEEIQDENSVIFRVADLKPKKRAPTSSGPRVTRQANIDDIDPPTDKPKPVSKPAPGLPEPRPSLGRVSKRDAREVTREVAPAPPSGRGDDSGVHDWPGGEEHHESTMISSGPPSFGGGFLMENAGEEGVDATQISSAPMRSDDTEQSFDPGGNTQDLDDDDLGGATVANDEDGPTIQRDFRDAPKPTPKGPANRGSAPAALAAKIHAPAVSELRKPRPSRKTPGAGVAAPPPKANVLQAIVGARPAEPMPAPTPPRSIPAATPRSSGVPDAPASDDDSGGVTLRGDGSVQPIRPGQAPPAPSQPQPPPSPPYGGYASTPPQGVPPQPGYGYPQGYPPQPGYPPTYPPQPVYPQGGYPPQPGYPQGYPPQGYPQPSVTPGALYPQQPYGAPPPKPMTLTGQLRLFEADELAPQYRVSGGGARTLKLAIAAIAAVSAAAGVTYVIIHSSTNTAPSVASVRVESLPPGGEVTFDGTRIAGATPLTIDGVPVGTRHEVKIDLPKHKAHVETIDIPKDGGEVPVKAVMDPITGKLRVVTTPDGADIYIDGQLRGRSPKTVEGIDMASAKRLELRMKDFQPIVIDLTWPANGEINIDQKLVR